MKYAIAIHSMDHDYRPYRTRYWGDGSDIFVWDNIDDASAYNDSIGGEFFTDKRCIIDDVTIELVDGSVGSTITPTWSSPRENPRNVHTEGSPLVGTTEGYEDEPEYNTKTVDGYRIVLEVDQGWFEAIAGVTEYAESGELCSWISTEGITREIDCWEE